MSAKIASENQHLILHEYWPNNCCLCNRELEIGTLKIRILELEKMLENKNKEDLAEFAKEIYPV